MLSNNANNRENYRNGCFKRVDKYRNPKDGRLLLKEKMHTIEKKFKALFVNIPIIQRRLQVLKQVLVLQVLSIFQEMHKGGTRKERE